MKWLLFPVVIVLALLTGVLWFFEFVLALAWAAVGFRPDGKLREGVEAQNGQRRQYL